MVNNYSEDDLKSLAIYLSKSLNSLSVDNIESIRGWPYADVQRAIHVLEFVEYSYSKAIKDSPMLLSYLNIPFEDLPLHINIEFSIDLLIVRWRLERCV